MPTQINKYKNVTKHLLTNAALIQIVKDFDNSKINYRILKGIPLNQMLYGKKLMRYSNDIDLLIDLKNLNQVHNYLINAGFQLLFPYSLLSRLSKKRSYLKKLIVEVPYVHPQKKTIIDLHWFENKTYEILMCSGHLNTHNSINISDQNIKILYFNQNFYYLCLHGSQHLWERKQWLDDLIIFVKKFTLNWNNIICLAKKTKGIRPLLEAKILLEKEFQIKMPALPSSFMDLQIIKLRLFFIQSKWFEKLKEQNNCKKQKIIKKIIAHFLCLLFTETITDKFIYTARVLIIRYANFKFKFKFKFKFSKNKITSRL